MCVSESVPVCVRRLEIGDYAWVAVPAAHLHTLDLSVDSEIPEHNLPHDEAVVLDYVVERKDVNDLASSIVGKRYDSQKSRLLQTGIQTRIFLVEGSTSEVTVPLPSHTATAATWEDRMRSASIESHVHDGFLPVRTVGRTGTAVFLRQVSEHLASKIAKDGLGCNSVLMSEGCMVRLPQLQEHMLHLKHDISASDLLRVMLSRAIAGLGPRVSEAIVASYPTLPDLLDALDRCSSSSQCERLVREACRKAECHMPPAKTVQLLWSLFDGPDPP